MCGITGIISSDATVPIRERRLLLDRMCKAIRHRGPDEQGTLVEGRAALGMRRLSIIDLKTGQQPIFNEAGNLAIVFNGEVYNYREVKKELELIGHRFKTNSDTEVVVHAFEEYGHKCLSRLRGMFAFAIWDMSSEKLFIARDRVGKKPLFYTLTSNGDFVFGSELKALFEFGAIEKEIDPAALDAYVSFGYVPEDQCIFKNFQKLPPGHFLEFERGRVRLEEYWDFDYSTNPSPKSEKEYIEQVRDKIEEAVRVRLISEVPLGAFLSGGIDSATVVAMMAKNSTTPVKTFSIGFNEDSFNELKFARVTAKQFNTDHDEFIVTPDLLDVVEEIVWHFDEPFSDSSSVPTFLLSKMAREHVTVVLSGDGGDELFAGYTRYLIDKRRSRFGQLPKTVRSGLLRPFSEALPHGAKGKNYIYNVSLDPIDRYIDSISQFNRPQKRSLYSASFQASVNGSFGSGASRFKSTAHRIHSKDQLVPLLYLDSKTYLPGDILTKVDRMTMANSLEARAPLLDHELIDLVTTIPAKLKISGSETKHILKRAMEGILPPQILHRKKQGFGVPISVWINERLGDRIQTDLDDRRALERGYFNPKYIRALLNEHRTKRRDHSHQLWLLWMLELWHRRYVDL